MDILSVLGWAFCNAVVPLGLTTAVVAILGYFEGGKSEADYYAVKSLKDGQLFWAIIAMAAAACYEVVVAKSKTDLSYWAGVGLNFSLLTHIIIIIIAVTGAVFGITDAERRDAVEKEAIEKRIQAEVASRVAITIAQKSTKKGAQPPPPPNNSNVPVSTPVPQGMLVSIRIGIFTVITFTVTHVLIG